jgi:hypothetical protein
MTRRHCLVLSLTLLIALPVIGGSAQARGSSPLGTVRVFLAALARHDPRGVCATFTPELRRYVLRWQDDVRGRCPRAVTAGHFTSYSPGDAVRSIRIRRVVGVNGDENGNTRVRVVLFYRVTCQDEVSVIPGCRHRFEPRRDTFFLRRERGRWLIVKPGEIFDATDSVAPPAQYEPLTPPGDIFSVSRPAVIAASSESCPTGGVSVEGRHRVLLPSTPGKGIPASRAPWLHITGARLVWLGRQSLCATMTLGAAPRADSSYMLHLSQPQPDGSEVDDIFWLEIDGTGGVHILLKDPSRLYGRGRAPCPTWAGLTRTTLTLVVSPSDNTFRAHTPFSADVETESLQPGEPLLSHPLDASDTIPSFAGLKLPRAAGSRPRCA